jgi:hypothetical protein
VLGEPCDIVVSTLAELVQETLKPPPCEAAGKGAAAFHSAAIQHKRGHRGKKEFFTFVREYWRKV